MSEYADPNLALPIEQSEPVETAPVINFPDGVEVLVNPPDAHVDICFVHGLTGNRASTWTARGQTAPWPKTLLPSELPKACILTYGYDAYVVSKSVASSNRLIDHATNLVTDLTNDRRRRNASSRPLIFVAHSLGGLVCKEAILLSRNNPNRSRQDFFTNIKGVIFMGTPHKGSWMADWSKIPARALGLVKSTNKSLLEVLQTNNQYLESIHVRFLSMMREQREAGRQLEVACFFEELPLPTIGSVVSKESATFEGYDPVTIHANHRDMVKFGSTEENGYRRVVGELTAWESEIVNPQRLNTWTDNCTLVPKHSTGREKEITQLQELLFTSSDGQRVALVGLGGVGKTQIALQLAHLVKKDDQPRLGYSVIWMPALCMASFEQACTRMIAEFGLEPGSEENPKETFKSFLSSEKAGKWFLIIDNADSMETLYGSAQKPVGIADFIPDCEHLYILFTTRSREVAVNVANGNIFKLSEMDHGDARALLKGSLTQKDQVQDTVCSDELLRQLSFLPLAISQASAYMKINQVSIKEYLQLLQNTNQDLVELLSLGLRDSTHYDASQGAVATTWIVSFNQIRDKHEEAATLLSYTACLEPKAIPRALLPSLSSAQTMTRAIGTLCGYSFLSKREDGDTFDMHSLVHLAIEIWNKEEGRKKEVRDMAFAHIAQVFPIDDWENRELWQQYMPHALRLLTNMDGAKPDDFGFLGYKVGGCLLIDGRIRQAVAVLESVVAIEGTIFAENDQSLLKSQHYLASAYQSNGQIEEAAKLLEHVVAMRETTLAESHPDRLTSEHLLGVVYEADGQFEKAVKLFRHVVAVRADVLPDDHPSRQGSEKWLRRCYETLKKVSSSEE
ncbi:kinesin light chain [Fusarium beomiforme]|uniref:Kinesin light chain n=1 Tax=Fusarium beomiforme TaxID=44412 RepID=A0A9P5AJ21_9HYPO|nr:kinesin light chain [Fusarium beomiforme]